MHANSLRTQPREILIIDDDEFITEIVIASFEADREYVLNTFKSGAGSLKHLEKATPAAIILDLGLPDMDGMQLLHELHGRGITEKVPVVILSGDDDIHTKIKALKSGAAAYLSKPFFPNKLRETVMHLIES